MLIEKEDGYENPSNYCLMDCVMQLYPRYYAKDPRCDA